MNAHNAEMVRLQLVPVALDEARRFVGAHHRHNLPSIGWKFGVGVAQGDKLVGVAMAARPVARALDDGRTLEVIRSCTDGTPNANSMLYGAVTRAAKALGYARLFTYTLAEEPGTSLKAAGWIRDAELDPRPAWEYTGQSRMQKDLFGQDRRPPGPKVRWVRWLTAQYDGDVW
jgi:hypothetical protein